MRSLDARLEELERREPRGEPVTIILRELVMPGEPEKPLTRLRHSISGQVWGCEAGEAEEAFLERVYTEVRKASGTRVCAMLIGDSN